MTGRARNSCGHEAAASTSLGYADYLQLPGLLSLQQPVGSPSVPDELLFIIVHQTHELWFKQMRQDLALLMGHLDADEWRAALARLERLLCIVRLLAQHLDVLSSMPASEFQRFRSALGSASGMQSEQYREIERLAGYVAKPLDCPLAAASAPSSVRSAFLRALGRSQTGAPISGTSLIPSANAVSERLERLWQEEEWSLERTLAERLLEFDSEMTAWRGRHVTLARQMIGEGSGTGGSSGVGYLQAAVARRYFPELQAARLGLPRSEAQSGVVRSG